MQRRKFIALAVGVAAAWPLEAHAQQTGRFYRVGFLWDGPDVFPDALEAFRQGLRELGYEEGRNIVIEYRWAEGKPERMRELAEELVRLKVDVIMPKFIVDLLEVIEIEIEHGELFMNVAGIFSATGGRKRMGVIALLMLYPQLPIAKIVGSDIAHAVPLTLVAGLGHWMMGSVNWAIIGSLLAGSLPGIFVGSYFAIRIPERALRLVLATTLFMTCGVR